ncbi:hypothetical protein QN224_29475 [Sinorhizobium sp. 8-89]|uniref:hypothetical protein n=1 Tax=Sinorhizobium sp. 7-81 TaxID=3049087 RepID=UPI0024C43BFF|nr:hypothetical protein [Sinorhizobium sp. 7-81]MDK1389514.1 hypothetical protein [Sinorhizobium sp. 7-81]
MPMFKLPLSGDVTQTIPPWAALFSPFNNQYSAITVNLGRSSAPAVEEEVLAEVGSYGKQLGRIGDALLVLLKHFRPETPLASDEQEAIDALKQMLDEIATIKEHHRREVLRP